MLKNLIAAAILLGSANAFAAYGQAGCGLGAMVFADQSGPVQIFAATLNGTGVQTFGMTSGTSECESAFASYVEANQEVIATEMARGQGETLAGLLQAMGCEDVNAASSALKANYSNIFPTANVEAAKVQSTIRATLVSQNVTCASI